MKSSTENDHIDPKQFIKSVEVEKLHKAREQSLDRTPLIWQHHDKKFTRRRRCCCRRCGTLSIGPGPCTGEAPQQIDPLEPTWIGQ